MKLLPFYFFISCFFSFFLSSLAAELQIVEDAKNDLQKALDGKLREALVVLVKQNPDYSDIINIIPQIKTEFIEDETITEYTFDLIYVKILEEVTFLQFSGKDEHADRFLKVASEICQKCKKSFLDALQAHQTAKKLEEQIENNKKSLKTLADVCHLFKEPVQWLLLTSKASGFGDLFKDVPVLLENIRTAFLEKFSPNQHFDLQDKLDFIIDSFDFYLSGTRFTVADKLKTDFLKLVRIIVQDLKEKSVEELVDNFSTGLGQFEIFTEVDFVESSNEELWNFIIQRIENLRPELEFNCQIISGSNFIDFITLSIENLIRNRVPFTLETARSVITSAFSHFYSEIPANAHSEFEFIKSVFEEASKNFDDDLRREIEIIKLEYSFKEEFQGDLSIPAVASLLEKSK